MRCGGGGVVHLFILYMASHIANALRLKIYVGRFEFEFGTTYFVVYKFASINAFALSD